MIYGRVYGPDMDDPDMWYHVGQVQLGGVGPRSPLCYCFERLSNMILSMHVCNVFRFSPDGYISVANCNRCPKN